MTYSVLIPWADRAELEISLGRNRALFERHALEVLVINAGGNYRELTSLVRRAAVRNVKALDIPGARFNWPLCLNIGAMSSRGEYLFLLDADIVLGSDVFADARDHLRSGSRFVTVDRIVESDPPPAETSAAHGPDLSFFASLTMTKEMVTTDGRRAVLRRRTLPGTRVAEGVVLVASRHLRAVGGLNSRLGGYGYDDTDFQLRLQFMLGLERVEAGEVIHLTHAPKDGDHRVRNEQSCRQNMITAYQNYRRGDYLGSFESDVQTWGDKVVTHVQGEAA